jgi:hypothetical protein
MKTENKIKIFDEQSLLTEVERVWGRHGAHYEVLNDLIKRSVDANEIIEKQVEWIDVLKIHVKKDITSLNSLLKKAKKYLKLYK